MPIKPQLLQLHSWRGMDWVAVLYALMLSLACLARGAVNDTVLALLILASLPLLLLALRSTKRVNPEIALLGIIFLSSFSLVVLLQYILAAPLDIFTSTSEASNTEVLYDRAAALHGIGRMLWFIIIFWLALLIGGDESCARLFLMALLVSGTACVTLTFLITRLEMMTSTTPYPFHHGLVNSNNAATYLGCMLLIGIAQLARSFRRPTQSLIRLLLDFIDGLNLQTIIRSSVVIFSLIIMLVGLLMTASRGGILLSLLCSTMLIGIILLKINLSPNHRRIVFVVVPIVIAAILFWGLSNYGKPILDKLHTDNTSANTRLEIIAATLPMIADSPLLGTGLGSFAGAFQPYRPATISSDGILDKAHNSYMEFAAEMGLPLTIILLATLIRIGFLLIRGIVSRRERYILPALGFSVWLLAALHSAIDFPLQIPGITAVFIAITIVCTCQCDLRFYTPIASSTQSRKRLRIRKRSNAKPI